MSMVIVRTNPFLNFSLILKGDNMDEDLSNEVKKMFEIENNLMETTKMIATMYMGFLEAGLDKDTAVMFVKYLITMPFVGRE